jgi:glycosyltransferase involved in cell wall biosynthesis
MDKPARLVLVLQDLLHGGSQRHALELAKGIDRARFAPEFWMLTSGADFAPQAQAADVPLRWLTDKPLVGPKAIAALGAALRQERPELVMPLTAVPNIWVRVLAKLAKPTKVVATCRGGGAIKRQHERFLASLAQHHIANTKALKAGLMALGRADAQVTAIANGVDVNYFIPPHEESRPVREVILCVARLVEDKDLRTLFAAFAVVGGKRPEAELWLVGEGPLKARLMLAARRLPYGERIRFFPGGPDLRGFYQQAKVLVLSSVREGLPNVVLEGMACGLPVVATAVGGLPEVVDQGVTGLLSPASDPQGLAASLLGILGDEGQALAMGLAGREKAVERYSLKAMLAGHEDVFTRVLAGN